MMEAALKQIRDATDLRGWTIPDLLKHAKIELDQSTMSRKLSGKTPMTLGELQQLVQALQITIAFVPVA